MYNIFNDVSQIMTNTFGKTNLLFIYQIIEEVQHLHIWEQVLDMKMVVLREIASEIIVQSLSSHMPEFLHTYKSEFLAKKSSDGESRAVRWILDRLVKSKDIRWPDALQDALKCNDALLNEIRREFWHIHDRSEYFDSYVITSVYSCVELCSFFLSEL